MNYYKLIKIIFFIVLICSSQNLKAQNRIEHKIAVLVNEEIITSYDIIQRLKLGAIIKGISLNSINNQILVNNTVDELIHEKLKSQKIKEYEIEISEDEYLQFETNFFDVNNTNKNLIIDLLDKNNIKHEALKDLLIGELSWKKLINGLYYRLTSVSNLEVDEIIKKNPEITNEQAKNLVIQRQLDLQSSKMLRDMMNEATIEYK